MSNKLGDCILCKKELKNVEDLMQNPDEGSIVTFERLNEMRIIGNYGSTVFDQCIGFFTDYDVFNKFKKKFEETSENILYICDECLSKLIKENKIFYIENAQSPLFHLSFSTLPPGNVSQDKIATTKDLYIPIKYHCLALKFNDGAERLCNIANNYMEFKGKYEAHYDSLSNEVLIFQDNIFNFLKSVCENDVLVLYDNGVKFEVMSEEHFKQRFTFFV